MLRLVKIFILLGAIFLPIFLLAQTIQKTDKIKITSYYNIDEDWTFNLFDYAINKKIVLVNNIPNSGYKLISFNEQTQIATVSTPRGVFLVALQEDTPNDVQLVEQVKPKEEFDPSMLTRNPVTRKRILDNIK